MKRLLALVLALLLLSGCSAPARVREFGSQRPNRPSASPTETIPVATLPPETEPVQTASITPAFYKVTDDEGHTVWLMGSIHVGLPSFYPLPAYITDAYKNADALVVECDVVAFSSNLSQQLQALQGMMYHDGSTIGDHLPEELYTYAVEILKEQRQYSSALDVYTPIFWSSAIDNYLTAQMGFDSELGIDMYFLNDAYDTGKEILEIESVEFQYDMLGGFPEQLQVLMLEGSVYNYENPDEAKEQLQALVDAWALGDPEGLYALLSEEGEFESEEERELYEIYNDEMIVKRNRNMADYAEEALASGKEVFICVGAAHVVGEGAMADLLQQRGYTVELIRP